MALALRKTGHADSIALWARSESSRRVARQLGFEEVHASPADAVHDAGLVVLCTPVPAMPPLAESIRNVLRPDASITDAGSTKQDAVALLEPILGPRYVGAHPIAGSEQSGMGAARDALFQAAPCILTPTAGSDPGALEVIEAFWRSLGCRTSRMTPAEHDALLARLSHLPHVAASALVRVACHSGPEAQAFAGGGYRDTTRVASGSPSLWVEILLSNRLETASALREMARQLEEVATKLDREDAAGLHDFLEQAKSGRDQFANFSR